MKTKWFFLKTKISLKHTKILYLLFMIKISDYLNTAQAISGAGSDRGLARLLKVSQTLISKWRLGKTLPTKEFMLKIAELANMDKTVALIVLEYWKSSGEARLIFKTLFKKKLEEKQPTFFATSESLFEKQLLIDKYPSTLSKIENSPVIAPQKPKKDE